MGLRTRINDALKASMKAKETQRVSTLRLISAAIKDRDIAARVQEGEDIVTDADIISILGKMVKQRRESARAYEEGGRLELAASELEEIGIIEEFLPKPLSDTEVDAAIAEAMTATEAASIRDMGRVMAALKESYAGRMDFASVGVRIKERLS